MTSNSHGLQREKQVREIAARLGVADFVYTAPPIRKGNSLREATGDGLLIVREQGAVLQVKARDPDSAASDSDTRVAAWIKKQAAIARDQGFGSKRELARRLKMSVPVVVTPVRATVLSNEQRKLYDLEISFLTDNWPIIVVLDHPRSPEIDLGFEPGVLSLTLKDWWELNRRIRSTAGLLDYCYRVNDGRIHVPLGREGTRYAAMQAADVEAARGFATSLPYLADSVEFDSLGTDIFHDVINKVWPADGVIPWRSASEYRKIVEFLDSIPPQMQSVIGRWFLRKRAEIESGKMASSGLIRPLQRDRLVFGCSNGKHWDKAGDWASEIGLLTVLRHAQAFESGAQSDSITLGVGALVEERAGKSGVSYTFVLLAGQDGILPIPPNIRADLESQYGVFNEPLGTTTFAASVDGGS